MWKIMSRNILLGHIKEFSFVQELLFLPAAHASKALPPPDIKD